MRRPCPRSWSWSLVTRTRSSAVAALAVLTGVIAGCGGDDKKAASNTVPTTPATTQTAPPQTAPAPTTPTPPKPPAATSTTPDSGGGTEPARTELEFRGTRSGVKPRQAGVAPYISVRITLTSEDGSAHTLTIGRHTAKVGGTRTSAFFTLPGLRPGKSYRGTADGKPVRILSTAEPGP
jgi:hypothetical protein